MEGPQCKVPTFLESLLAAGPKKSLQDDFFMVIVDGTGAFRDSTYGNDMFYSFCSQMHRLSYGHTSYKRGPSTEGFGMEERADWMVSQLAMFGSNKRLMLAGYSRGASAAIMAAERLERDNKRVDSMFLFDPVARHIADGGEVIPANVDYVAIVRRRLDRDLVARSGNAIPKTIAFAIGGVNPLAYDIVETYNYIENPMRTWFGFAGTEFRGRKEDLVETAVPGTHGAIGGVGTADVPEDKSAQEIVAEWMNQRLVDRHVPIKLVAVPPARR